MFGTASQTRWHGIVLPCGDTAMLNPSRLVSFYQEIKV
jgi:hypothetical protein